LFSNKSTNCPWCFITLKIIKKLKYGKNDNNNNNNNNNNDNNNDSGNFILKIMRSVYCDKKLELSFTKCYNIYII